MATVSEPLEYTLEQRHYELLLTDLKHLAVLPHFVADYVPYDANGNLLR